jgi:HD-like signal output (HDOD) protein/CheY-like chemotaxis protein
MEMDNQDITIKKSILFVDDEPNVLNGLERMLRPMRNVWTTSFAESSQKALDLMKGSHFDVVVTDIRMPVMNGLQLLTEVKRLYPDTVRIILSGESDRELTLKAVNVSHQFLNKPCDTEILKSAISRIGDLSALLQKDSIKSMVSRVDSLPSLPSLYVEIMKELQSDDSSIRKIGDIISSDLAMTAKILQLVNSSYFSLPRHISSPEQAVFLLGLDTIKSLVLSIQVFSQFKLKKMPEDYLSRLWNHSMVTAASAKKIATQERQEQVLIDNSFMAGLLHDSGKLVMASCFSDQYAELVSMAEGTRLFTEKEKEMFDVTHAEAGAYLMGLWGLPYTIIEAIAFHHIPGRSNTKQFTPLTAVYIANMLENEKSGYFVGKSEFEIDHEYMSAIELKAAYPFWDMPESDRLKEVRAYEQ